MVYHGNVIGGTKGDGIVEKPKPTAETLVSCDVCRKEIPQSAVFTPEAAEYIGTFCGLECYQKFLEEAGRPATREK